MVILTFGAVFMVEYHREKIMEIAENSDMIVANMEEMISFAQIQDKTPKNVFTKAHQKLSPKERLFVVTDGANGVYVSKFDYQKNQIEFILQSFPKK